MTELKKNLSKAIRYAKGRITYLINQGADTPITTLQVYSNNLVIVTVKMRNANWDYQNHYGDWINRGAIKDSYQISDFSKENIESFKSSTLSIKKYFHSVGHFKAVVSTCSNDSIWYSKFQVLEQLYVLPNQGWKIRSKFMNESQCYDMMHGYLDLSLLKLPTKIMSYDEVLTRSIFHHYESEYSMHLPELN